MLHKYIGRKRDCRTENRGYDGLKDRIKLTLVFMVVDMIKDCVSLAVFALLPTLFAFFDDDTYEYIAVSSKFKKLFLSFT